MGRLDLSSCLLGPAPAPEKMKLFLLAYLVGQGRCCLPGLLESIFGGSGGSGGSGGGSSSSSCKTTTGQACVFPFTFNGVTHNECTLSGYSTPWCSTQTDGSGNHVTGNYGDCASDCPGGGANRVLKIVGGVQTEENEYPWQVGLISSSGSRSPFCGGTLISSKEVLTAAHCTESGGANYVLVGEHNLNANDGERAVRVCSVLEHNSYNSGTVDYDFAVLRLCEDVTFQTDILPACLPTSSSTSYENIDAVVSGWGTMSSGGSSSSILREVTVRTMSNSACTSGTAYSSGDITSRMLCASNPGKDSCQGDSGGPLVTQTGSFYTLIGVVSWGQGCAQSNAPGVYARVTSQLSWVTSRITGTPCSA